MMVEAQTLTLTTLILHLRAQLLDALYQPATPENRAVLAGLWRICLTIHDLAEVRQNRVYVKLMERMVDAIGDYDQIDQPEAMNWEVQLPTVQEIEEASRA